MFILNSPFMHQQSIALAKRIECEGGTTVDERTTFLHRLLFARDPRPVDLQVARDFITQQPATDEATKRAWQRYAHALLSSNEFFYVD
jgi:hypothetical protein